MKYGVYIGPGGNQKIAPVNEQTQSALERAAAGAGVGAAFGTVIPGVGNTVGGIIGGGVSLVRGLFGGRDRERAADGRGARHISLVWKEAFGPEKLQLQRAPGGGKLISVSGQYPEEAAAGLVDATRRALREYSCSRGGCGRVAVFADSLMFAPENAPPASHEGQVARITIEQEYADAKSVRPTKQFDGRTIASLGAIAAAVFLRAS